MRDDKKTRGPLGFVRRTTPGARAMMLAGAMLALLLGIAGLALAAPPPIPSDETPPGGHYTSGCSGCHEIVAPDPAPPTEPAPTPDTGTGQDPVTVPPASQLGDDSDDAYDDDADEAYEDEGYEDGAHEEAGEEAYEDAGDDRGDDVESVEPEGGVDDEGASDHEEHEREETDRDD